MSARPLVLEHLHLSSAAWDVAWIEAQDPRSTARHLAPGDVCQFVLALTPRDPDAVQHATLEQLAAAPAELRVVHVAHTLGSLAAYWRVPGGGWGVLRTAPLLRTLAMQAAVACGDAPAPRLVARVALEKPSAARAQTPCTCTVRVTLDDVRPAPRHTYTLALVPRAETWTEMLLLGASPIVVPLETEVPVPVLPLHSGVVRSGAMALVLQGYSDAPNNETYVLREWPCFVELVADDFATAAVPSE